MTNNQLTSITIQSSFSPFLNSYRLQNRVRIIKIIRGANSIVHCARKIIIGPDPMTRGNVGRLRKYDFIYEITVVSRGGKIRSA